MRKLQDQRTVVRLTDTARIANLDTRNWALQVTGARDEDEEADEEPDGDRVWRTIGYYPTLEYALRSGFTRLLDRHVASLGPGDLETLRRPLLEAVEQMVDEVQRVVLMQLAGTPGLDV